MKIKHPGNSKHHLFAYHEVRARLVEVFGEPKTDVEHIFIQRKTNKFRREMELFGLDEKYHKKLHRGVRR